MTRAWNSTVEDAIHAWIVAGSGLPAAKVVWALQRGPIPESPYISARCAVLRSPGIDWIDAEATGDPIPSDGARLRVRGPRVATLELQCFADPTDAAGAAAQSILNDVVASARLPSVREGLRAAGVGVSTSEPIQFAGVVTDKVGFEPRAITRVMLHLANEVSETGPNIETVQLVNQIIP